MLDKHPQVAPPPLPEGEPGSEPLSVSSQEVYEVIRGFKPGTAPGPSSLRGEHLKEMGGRGEGRGSLLPRRSLGVSGLWPWGAS